LFSLPLSVGMLPLFWWNKWLYSTENSISHYRNNIALMKYKHFMTINEYLIYLNFKNVICIFKRKNCVQCWSSKCISRCLLGHKLAQKLILYRSKEIQKKYFDNFGDFFNGITLTFSWIFQQMTILFTNKFMKIPQNEKYNDPIKTDLNKKMPEPKLTIN